MICVKSKISIGGWGLRVEGTECRVHDWYEIKCFDRGFGTKVSGFTVESREQTKAAALLRNPGGGFRVDHLEVDEELRGEG